MSQLWKIYIYVTEVLQDLQKTKIIEEIMITLFPKLMKTINTQIQEAQ